MSSDRLRRIRVVGRTMKLATWTAAALLVVAYAAAITSPAIRGDWPLFAGVARHAPAFDLWLVSALAAIPIAVSVAALARTARLFAAFERGEVLEHRNGRLMIAIGGLTMAATVVNNLSASAIGAYLSHRNGAGSLTISISSGEIGAFGSAILIVVLGWVVAEAADVAHDHRQIV